MIELTKEQVEKAATAARASMALRGSWEVLVDGIKQDWRNAVTAAAPFLQSPLAPPTMGEIEDSLTAYRSNAMQRGVTAHSSMENALFAFITRRNALLFPAPTRQQKMAAIIRQIKDPDRAAEQIVMLDECGE